VINLGRSWRVERSPEVRQQLVLLLGGTAFGVGPALFLFVIPSLVLGQGHYVLSMDVAAIAMGIMPLAFAYAITQHQLLGVRNFIRRGVVYIVMGSSVLLVFSLSAALLGSVAQGWEKTEVGLIGFSFFVFLLAFSYSHLQRRVEHLVDRFIYHDAYDYKEALLQFSSQLASEQKLQVLADELVERTCRLMNLMSGVLLVAVHPGEKSPIAKNRARPGLISGFLTTPDAAQAGHALNHYGLDLPGLWSSENDPSPAQAPGGEHAFYLELYAKYGEFADHLADDLQDELSSIGIQLHEGDTARASVRLADTHSMCEADSVRKVASLADAVAGSDVSEVMKTGGSIRDTGRLDIDSLHSFLGVPLWTRSRFVGVLCLTGKKTGERFTKDDLSLLNTLGSQAALAIYNAQLHEAREAALLDTITALAHAIEAKDGYTIQHCEKMTGRAVALAQALGLPRQEIENVRLGAILHDVGKIGIPDAVLNKPSKLTPDEYEIIKEHAAIGARIVQSVGALKGVVPIVHHHQERYDGSGYPLGLAGEDIPVGARIIGVVDTYGAMTEDRVYRKAPGHEAALTELQRLAGKQFDPDIVQAFVKLLQENPEVGELEFSEVH
jgi:putative nucleotidyltransferase with HDIG domain